MKILNTTFITLLLITLSTEPLWAIYNAENNGRWEKPIDKGPDKEVPGYLINLGPTGARAILKETSFVVKYVFKKSPAAAKLRVDDEITGVNGRKFTTKHVFGKFYGMDSKVGYEGPIMDFGNAIEESEGKDGILKLDVVRKNKEMKIQLRLRRIGRFSPTYPFKCSKSDKLLADAVRYLLKHEDRFKGPCHAKATAGLALLSQGKLKEARELARSWNTLPGKNPWTWPASYQCIFLCEYYLKTRDRKVLKTIQGLVDILYTAQVRDPEKYKDWMHTGHPQGKNFLHGGLGHIVEIDGYGTMSTTTLLGMLSWELAKDCGIKVKQEYLDAGYACIQKHTHKNGYIGYRFATGAYSPVVRQGLSIIVHKLEKKQEAADYINRVTANLTQSKTRLNDGHGDNVLGVFWGLLGIQVSGNKAAVREMFDYNKAFINMSRTHDGSFVAQPGRNPGDKGYYMSSRVHPTAAMILILSMDKPRLKIQGK